MRARVRRLKAVESAAAEIANARTRTCKWPNSSRLESERKEGETRDGQLQVESEQIRARLAKSKRLCTTRQRLMRLAIAAANSRHGAKLQSERNTWPRLACKIWRQRRVLMADTMIPLVTARKLTTEDQAYRDMRTRLEAMGPVNMMALEEYKETAERHEFLGNAAKDLLEAIENMQRRSRKSNSLAPEV